MCGCRGIWRLLHQHHSTKWMITANGCCPRSCHLATPRAALRDPREVMANRDPLWLSVGREEVTHTHATKHPPRDASTRRCWFETSNCDGERTMGFREEVLRGAAGNCLTALRSAPCDSKAQTANSRDRILRATRVALPSEQCALRPPKRLPLPYRRRWVGA